MRKGSVREGSVRKGSVREGSVREGSVRERSVREGSVREGFVREWSVRHSCKRSQIILLNHSFLCLFPECILRHHCTGAAEILPCCIKYLMIEKNRLSV